MIGLTTTLTTTKTSLWDRVWEIADYMEDDELESIGVSAENICRFFELGLSAFRNGNTIYVENDLDVIGIYSIEEIRALSENNRFIQEFEQKAV